MKNSEENSLMIKIGAGFVILMIIGGLYYFFSGEDNTQLLDARAKVRAEKAKLAELNTRHNAEKAAIAQIQEQYFILRNTVMKNTDIFFQNPESNDPKIALKINDKELEKTINQRRLQITKLLKEWDKKIDDLNSNSYKTPPKLSDIVSEARNDIEYIRQYIDELEGIIGGLTPSNSQLQQTQIYTYESIIEASANQVEQLISSIDSIESSIEQIYESVDNTDNEQTNSTTPDEMPFILTPTPTPTPSPTPTPTPTTPVNNNPPIVTPSQIEEQEEVVEQAEEEEDLIEQGITPVPTPVPTPTPTPEPYVYYPVSPQPGGAQTIIEYLHSLPSSNPDRSGWPDRVVDTSSGKPLLIDGSN